MSDVIDRESLRQKYREERDKRLRADGNAQYRQPTGKFAHLLDDPYTEVVPREPVHDEVTVACIGAGWAGLVTGAALVQAGITDVRLIDKAGDVGGVWYWNRYPGAMCDTASMIYLPLLEETGHRPSKKYTFAPENLEHAQRIATTFGLYENALLSTGITDITWDDAIARWVICTDRGDEFRARYITIGTGPLHRPKLPGIEGLDDFAGHTFHTSRWDYDYTGGTPEGAPMDRLADKRVGIIGTGATAVQCIAHLAQDAQELYVFQRTPSSIDVRNNHPLDDELFDSLEPGWQEKWLRNFTTLQTGGFADEDLVKDGWTDIAQRIRDRVVAAIQAGETGEDIVTRAYEDSDDEKMNEIRDRVESIVGDRATAEALKPWYRQLCKRPCFHDYYLDAYNLPTCHLVDTNGQGVERIDETGVWANGEHYDLDCLVFASGFEVGTEHERRWGFDLVGRDGLRLSDHWADGMRTMHGIHTRGFPNAFVIGMNQGANLISNIPHNLVEAGRTAAAIIAHAEQVGATRVEVAEQAEDDWVGLLQTGVGLGFLGSPECTPGYYNNEGQPAEAGDRLNMCGYPQGPMAYFDFIATWRESGEFAGLEFHTDR